MHIRYQRDFKIKSFVLNRMHQKETLFNLFCIMKVDTNSFIKQNNSLFIIINEYKVSLDTVLNSQCI